MKDSIKEMLNNIPEDIKKQSSDIAENIINKDNMQLSYDFIMKQLEDLLKKNIMFLVIFFISKV